jgi:hypothetical protein
MSTEQTQITAMNAAFTLDALVHWPVRHSILLVGDHGVGKDGIVKTAAMMQGIPCVDIRLSQNDVGDIKGMPFRVKGKTVFAPPDWMPFKEEEEMELEELLGNVATAAGKRSAFPRGILFFNEINRATREVQQAAFEIVLDRTMNTRVLRDGWRIVSAVNGDEHYQVNVMDVAFKSRFYVIKFRPSVEEWLTWADDPIVKPAAINPEVLKITSADITGPLHPAITGYIRRHPKMLDPTDELLSKAESDVTLQVQNRRAWHMFSDTIKVREALNGIGEVPEVLSKSKEANDYLLLMGTGYVGPMAAVSFAQYIATDYKVLSGEIILNGWNDDIRSKIEEISKAGRTVELARYCDMVVDVVVSQKSDKMSAEQKRNLTEFFTILPNARRAHLYKVLANKARIAANDWYSDKRVEKLVLEALMSPGVEKSINK